MARTTDVLGVTKTYLLKRNPKTECLEYEVAYLHLCCLDSQWFSLCRCKASLKTSSESKYDNEEKMITIH